MGALSKLSDVAAGAAFGAPSDRLEALGGKRIRARDSVDGDGDAWQMPDGSIQGFALRIPSAAWLATQAPLNTAQATRTAKEENNATRLDVLGKRAARFARDPVANAPDCFLPGVYAAATAAHKTDIVRLHELLARLAFGFKADDAA